MKQIKTKMLGKEVEIIIPNAAAYIRLKNKYGEDKYGLAKELLNLYVSPPLNLEEEIIVDPVKFGIGGVSREHTFNLKQAIALTGEILRDISNPDFIKYAEKVVTKEEIDTLTYEEFNAIYEALLTALYPVAEKVGEVITPFHTI